MWGARLTSAQVDGAIDEAIAWFALRRAPGFLWWTGPHTEPIDLPARLLERGLDAVLFTTRLGHPVDRRLGFRGGAGTIGINSTEPPGRA